MSIGSFHLRHIKLTNFKNYTTREFSFSDKLNFIVGNNGQGKTNLLDAIYYSCLTKSYLSTNDLYVPNFDSNFFRIETNFSLNSDKQLVEIKYLKQEKKEIKLNSSVIEKQSTYIGRFPCVIITPDDNSLILGHGEVRRRFLDFTLSQFSSEYLSNLMTYNKILAQRNALLKSFYDHRSFDRALLDVYNTSLIASARVIHRYRLDFIQQLTPIFDTFYRQIFEGYETSSITYDSELNNIDIEDLIIKNEDQDRKAQRTTQGVHTDDLTFLLNGYPLKKIGSQGQQKTFLLSLKLAQFELLKKEKLVYPVLLLDDIFDKLDADRVSKIFKLIHQEAFGQVFITHTETSNIESLITDNQIINYNIIKLGSI